MGVDDSSGFASANTLMRNLRCFEVYDSQVDRLNLR